MPNPIEDDWYVTGRDGTIEFTPKLLGMTNVGFFEDPFGRAVMSPDLDQDEAIVLIEVYGEGLGSAFWEIDISWDRPEVYAEIPF